jgi:hypothetical protein
MMWRAKSGRPSVAVSLFLQEGIQHSDGRIKLPSPGSPGLPDADVGPVGTFRRFENNSVSSSGRVEVGPHSATPLQIEP